MAKAVKICPVCNGRFPAKTRRKTCSGECHAKLTGMTGRATRKRILSETCEESGKVITDKRSNHVYWEPSPEYIAHQCSLIRAGLLVIDTKRARGAK